jgi:hypothetical protein
LTIIIVLDFSIGSLLKYYYFRQISGYLYRTTYAIEETTAEVLIFGSSKASHQYNPQIFEEKLGLSCYNVGRDGSSIFYQYAILQSALQRYTPKVIVLDITREFEKKKESYDRISMLLPYYDAHSEMRQIIELKSSFEKNKLISKIYPYNSMLFTIIAGNSQSNMDRHKNIKGFVPLLTKWNRPIKYKINPTRFDIDTTKIKIYESFIRDCIQSKIKIFIVSSPDYFIMKGIDKSNFIANKIAQKYNVKFLDYSHDTLFINNVGYFADISHLNGSGARIFSNVIADDIATSRK